MMKIGVVCEGPTDYPAIRTFVGAGLAAKGIEASFHPLAPEMDNTRPEGGWGLVFSWLAKYPAVARVQRYFAGGLFGGGLSSEKLDAIVIQLDADVLNDSSFTNYVANNLGVTLLPLTEPSDRADQITLALAKASQLDLLTDADVRRHVILPAVGSTEAWCVSVFSAQPVASNRFDKSQLTTAFMRALETTESKAPQDSYNNIDKSLRRRERYCEQHVSRHSRVSRDCAVFSRAMEELFQLSK